MALKTLLLRRKIDERNASLEELRAKNAEFEAREAELAAAIEELTAENTAEERSALESEVESFEAEYTAHRDAIAAMEEEVRSLTEAMQAEEARQNTNPPAAPAENHHEREDRTMNICTRTAFYKGMSIEQRDALVARQDVQDYLNDFRTAVREKRAINNIGLTIPQVLLGLLREVVDASSVTYKHINVMRVNGEGRQLVQGTIPEAVWTDCCANLNELGMTFYDLEFDCYRVGGYYTLCNANIEDSDLDLMAEVLTALGRAIAIAIDKAVFYGRSGAGKKMPLGIVTRLAQESQPENYPATARPWADLHSTNIRTINGSGMTGVQLIAAIAGAAAYAKSKYAKGELTWFMNQKTYGALLAACVEVNAAGAIVAGMGKTMPVVGGQIEIFDALGDNDIICGYFELYTLAERAGQKFAASEHVKFLQDQTVVKGTARYDGGPAIAEAFVIMNIANSTPAKTMTFAADGANTVSGVVVPATASLAVSDTLQLTPVLLPLGIEAPISYVSATTAKATVSDAGLVTGVASGSSVITVTAGDQSATCTVTVTST